MKKELTSEFTKRQHMKNEILEIFYYSDTNLKQVAPHKHSYYEFYYFLEGDIDYVIAGKKLKLKKGDFLLIPPGVEHKATICSKKEPYRRIVLWLNETFLFRLTTAFSDLDYCFQMAEKEKIFHYREEYIITQEIHWKLIQLIEEIHKRQPFFETNRQLKAADFLSYINRLLYDKQADKLMEKPLYLRVCDYINTHLSEELSLKRLSEIFYVSKYHLAHCFTQDLGLGVHQYVTKKRLQNIKEGLASEIPVNQLAESYGFSDYTSFFRAFKKEFQLSPTEYRKQLQSAPQLPR